VDVNDLIRQEEFFYADCIAIDHLRIVGYNIKDCEIEIDENIPINRSDLTNIFQNFSVEVDGSNYVGGEASAHGSCGFFYKKTGDFLNWALMSLDSDPFISVEVCRGSVRFLSSSGVTWVVPDDDVTQVYLAA
jgi:hypothetical protein